MQEGVKRGRQGAREEQEVGEEKNVQVTGQGGSHD